MAYEEIELDNDFIALHIVPDIINKEEMTHFIPFPFCLILLVFYTRNKTVPNWSDYKL